MITSSFISMLGIYITILGQNPLRVIIMGCTICESSGSDSNDPSLFLSAYRKNMTDL
jgi:hypothetical protein